MLSFQPDVDPSPESTRVSPMGDFVAQNGVVGGEASSPSLVPGSRFSGVVGKIREGRRRGASHSGCIEVLVAQGSFIRTMFKEKGDAGVTLGEGPGIEFGFGGETLLGLGANILECYDGRIRGGR